MKVTQEYAAHIALACYLGECCRFCGQKITTMEELRTVVNAGYHDGGRIAHEACWNAQPQEVLDQIHAEVEAGKPKEREVG